MLPWRVNPEKSSPPSHLPPCLVQAPSRLTTFRWWPMWVRILSSVIRALYSLAVAPSVPSAQRLVWAAKQPLGNAALGALFA